MKSRNAGITCKSNSWIYKAHRLESRQNTAFPLLEKSISAGEREIVQPTYLEIVGCYFILVVIIFRQFQTKIGYSVLRPPSSAASVRVRRLHYSPGRGGVGG